MMPEILPDTAPAPAPSAERDPVALLRELLRLMGYELEVSARSEPDRLVLEISGAEAGLLIGKKGQTLDALQFLLNKMVSRETEQKPIVVDSNGYRQRRVEALQQLANRLSEKAQRTGKVVAVNPMSAHDRRIIHLALKETPGVTTRSEGEGVFRRLLIVPSADKPLPASAAADATSDDEE
jgi:spoIIIJ-associated protein